MSVRFDTPTLKLFAAIVEEQSIAKAAEREHIAASAVSKRISDLEETLGIAPEPLHKGIEPTAAGYALLHHARAVLRNPRRRAGSSPASTTRSAPPSSARSWASISAPRAAWATSSSRPRASSTSTRSSPASWC
jgi:DNA-binding transcriptional LysR family regulator